MTTPTVLEPLRIREADLPSPLDLSQVYGDHIANFTEEGHSISQVFVGSPSATQQSARFMLSGPRRRVAYAGAEVRAAVITCGSRS